MQRHHYAQYVTWVRNNPSLLAADSIDHLRLVGQHLCRRRRYEWRRCRKRLDCQEWDLVVETYRVMGIADDYTGAAETLVHLRPVLENLPDSVVPVVDNWSPPDLRPLKPSEIDYVTPIPHSDIFIRPGSWIWIAGDEFLRACAELPELELAAETMEVRWNELDGGFRYWWGTIPEIADFARRIYTTAKRAMFRELYARNADTTILNSAFFVLDNIHYVDAHEQSKTSGLYLWEMHDEDRFQILRESVVLDGLFASGDEFDTEIRRQSAWHRRDAAPEEGAAYTPPVIKRPVRFDLSEDVPIFGEGGATMDDILRSIAEFEDRQ